MPSPPKLRFREVADDEYLDPRLFEKSGYKEFVREKGQLAIREYYYPRQRSQALSALMASKGEQKKWSKGSKGTGLPILLSIFSSQKTIDKIRASQKARAQAEAKAAADKAKSKEEAKAPTTPPGVSAESGPPVAAASSRFAGTDEDQLMQDLIDCGILDVIKKLDKKHKERQGGQSNVHKTGSAKSANGSKENDNDARQKSPSKHSSPKRAEAKKDESAKKDSPSKPSSVKNDQGNGVKKASLKVVTWSDAEDKKILKMKEIENKSYDEIAALLGKENGDVVAKRLGELKDAGKKAESVKPEEKKDKSASPKNAEAKDYKRSSSTDKKTAGSNGKGSNKCQCKKKHRRPRDEAATDYTFKYLDWGIERKPSRRSASSRGRKSSSSSDGPFTRWPPVPSRTPVQGNRNREYKLPGSNLTTTEMIELWNLWQEQDNEMRSKIAEKYADRDGMVPEAMMADMLEELRGYKRWT